MEQNKCTQYLQKLNGLTVFRGLLNAAPICRLRELLAALRGEPADADAIVAAYGCFAAELFRHDVNFSEVLKELLWEDENGYRHAAILQETPPPLLEETALRELAFFSELGQLSAADCKAGLPREIADFLPDWETSPLDFPALYRDFLRNIPTEGYGVFAEYHAFVYDADGLHPVRHPDPQRLSQLTGYERESGMVLRNTEALLQNTTPCNLLLYGDAGTGKSSTVKAVANELKDKGLRLIEVKKGDLRHLPRLMELLAENPLKFIIFIDDLSFAGTDEQFSALKAILEGGVAMRPQNTVIYATSNRRHMVKESMAERNGDDIHLNDTLQEMMSLSARFGMTITFLKPDKEEYLAIVEQLAEEYGLALPKDELFARAERFAIYQSGRSPRTAKHFIETQLGGL